jgi:hypothetical protein
MLARQHVWQTSTLIARSAIFSMVWPCRMVMPSETTDMIA